MLSPDQQKWIDHLSDTDTVTIIPYDPSVQEKFAKVKERIQKTLGKTTRVEHRGATSLRISGQDEIDVYIPVPAVEFYSFIEPLKHIFGEPRSFYPLERARFVTEEDGKHVDIFLVNEQWDGWLDALKFEEFLTIHPQALEAYRKLKESGHGLSVKEYYRRKIEFINSILAQRDIV